MSKEVKFETLDLAKVAPWKGNPRRIGTEELGGLKESLGEFGLVQPLVWNKRSGRLVGGHQRLKVLLDNGETHAMVAVVDLEDDQEKALNIALNSPEISGRFTADLRPVLKRIKAKLPDLSQRLRLPKIIIPAGVAVGGKKATDKPVEVKRRVKEGETWELGAHRLVCMDTMKPETFQVLMQGKKAAVAFTDPPYAIYGASTGVGGHVADDRMVRPFFLKIMETLKGQVQEFGHLYVCCDWRSWASLWDSAREARLSVKNCIVWDKGSAGQGFFYRNQHELVMLLVNTWREETQIAERAKAGMKRIRGGSNVWQLSRESKKEHGAQKPVALVSKALDHSAEMGDIVLDPFLGSGTTLIAAEQTGRVCYGVEIDPKYCDVTLARWETLTGQKAKRAGGIVPRGTPKKKGGK